jgi:NADPH-dependent 2,4-dienoyl-CoA reductase/sulfur reductase-like enzyme
LVDCQVVAIAIGVRPRIELARAAGLETDRGILVDEYLQIGTPDLFAAGDVAQAWDPFSGKAVLDVLWTVAIQQGRAAGINMAGGALSYSKGVPFNVTRLAGLTTTIVGTVGRGQDQDLLGIARGDSETWRELPGAIAAQDDFEVNRLRVLVGEKTLLGAIVMGDQSLSRPLYHLIARQVDISSVREQLLAPPIPLADLIAHFWSDWRRKDATAHL